MISERFHELMFGPGRYGLVEQFKRRPTVNASIGVAMNLDFELLGTNAVDGSSALSEDGGVTLTTAGASGDQVILVPHLDTAQSAWAKAGLWGSENSPYFDTIIKTASNIADIVIWAGLKLTNTSVVATDDDQVFFRFAPATSSGRWVLNHSRAGTDTAMVLPLAVAASTQYRITIEVESDRRIIASVNGVYAEFAIREAIVTAKDLIPYIGVQASAAAAKSIDVRRLACSRAN